MEKDQYTNNENGTEKEVAKEPRWYVVQTLAGYEKIALTNLNSMIESNNLQDVILSVLVPETEDIVEAKNGKKKVIKRKKFPSYVFIKMVHSNKLWYMVTQTRGVTSFCGPHGRPFPLSDDEVRRMQLEKVKIEELNIKIDDKVNIISGPLKDFIGEVKTIDIDHEKIKVSVSMMGREVLVELEFNQVEKI